MRAGQPPHRNTVGNRWRRTTSAAGLADLRLHDLRHFYASGLIASGCDVVTVQRALGHASATTTLSTYSHLWPSAEDRTRAVAQSLLAEWCGLETYCRALTWAFMLIHTLKRNSTTSPSAMT